jgi:hypothetical protein
MAFDHYRRGRSFDPAMFVVPGAYQPVVKVRLHSAGAASRLAALLLAQILPVFSPVAPCPGRARYCCQGPSVPRRTFTTGCYVCATFLAIVLSLPTAAAAPDDRAAQLLQAARAADGGESALAAVDALTASGELSIPGGQGGDIAIDVAPPDRFRSVQRLLFPMVGSAEVVHGLNRDIAWTNTKTRAAMPGAHVVDDVPASEDELRRLLQSELGVYALAWLLRPAGAFQQPFEHDAETEHLEASKADVLRATDEGGRAVRLFLDPKTHRPTQIRYWGSTGLVAHVTSRFFIGPGGGSAGFGRPLSRREPEEAEVDVKLADFKLEQGVMLAHRLQKRVNGHEVEELRVKRFTFNRVPTDAFDHG